MFIKCRTISSNGNTPLIRKEEQTRWYCQTPTFPTRGENQNTKPHNPLLIVSSHSKAG